MASKNAIAIGAESTVRLTLLVCDGLLVTAAVILTVFPIGETEGAVNTVAVPSPVCAGVSVPHEPLVILPVVGSPPQVTVQSIPAFAMSLEGIMLSVAFEPIESALT